MTNGEDPDQTLIWVFTVLSVLFLLIFKSDLGLHCFVSPISPYI